MLSTSSFSLEKNYVSFSEGYSPVAFGQWVDDKDIEFTRSDIAHLGFGSEVDSLVTFFYLSKEDKKKEIIDMHYLKDGSRAYIQKLLKRSADSFLGARNLENLHIYKTLYWGNRRSVYFNMKNSKGSNINWFEEFVCEYKKCFKSSYLMRGRGEARQLYLAINNGRENPLYSKDKLLEYEKFSVYPDLSSTEKYPLEVYLDRKKIDESVKKTAWYKSIEKLQLAVNDAKSESMVRFDLIKSALSNIFHNWAGKGRIRPRFETLGIQKTSFVTGLYGVKDFFIDSYIENSDFLWAFVRSKNQLHNNGQYYLFVYDKKLNSFISSDIPDYASAKINSFLRNKLVSNHIFGVSDVIESKEHFHIAPNSRLIERPAVAATESTAKAKSSMAEEKQSNFNYYILLATLILVLVFVFILYKRK